MNSEDKKLLYELLNFQRTAVLSVLDDGRPILSLIPYVLWKDHQSVLVHASSLAQHSAGLKESSPFGLIIHQQDSVEADPLQLARVSFYGNVHLLPKGEPLYDQGRDYFVKKYPSSEPTFLFGDFQLYLLGILKGRFVAGFGQIYNISPKILANLSN